MSITTLLADGLGTSVDETVAEFMIFIALAMLLLGYRRARGKTFPDKPRWVGVVMLTLGAGTMAAAFVVPQRYLRPKPSTARIASTAVFEIVSPTDGQVVGKRLKLQFGLTGARILATGTTKIRGDEGHIHVSIDGKLLGMTFGLSQVIDTGDFAPGPHLLEVEFVRGDHVPFSPRVVRTVRFVVSR